MKVKIGYLEKYRNRIIHMYMPLCVAELQLRCFHEMMFSKIALDQLDIHLENMNLGSLFILYKVIAEKL